MIKLLVLCPGPRVRTRGHRVSFFSLLLDVVQLELHEDDDEGEDVAGDADQHLPVDEEVALDGDAVDGGEEGEVLPGEPPDGLVVVRELEVDEDDLVLGGHLGEGLDVRGERDEAGEAEDYVEDHGEACVGRQEAAYGHEL